MFYCFSANSAGEGFDTYRGKASHHDTELVQPDQEHPTSAQGSFDGVLFPVGAANNPKEALVTCDHDDSVLVGNMRAKKAAPQFSTEADLLQMRQELLPVVGNSNTGDDSSEDHASQGIDAIVEDYDGSLRQALVGLQLGTVLTLQIDEADDGSVDSDSIDSAWFEGEMLCYPGWTGIGEMVVDTSGAQTEYRNRLIGANTSTGGNTDCVTSTERNADVAIIAGYKDSAAAHTDIHTTSGHVPDGDNGGSGHRILSCQELLGPEGSGSRGHVGIGSALVVADEIALLHHRAQQEAKLGGALAHSDGVLPFPDDTWTNTRLIVADGSRMQRDKGLVFLPSSTRKAGNITVGAGASGPFRDVSPFPTVLDTEGAVILCGSGEAPGALVHPLGVIHHGRPHIFESVGAVAVAPFAGNHDASSYNSVGHRSCAVSDVGIHQHANAGLLAGGTLVNGATDEVVGSATMRSDLALSNDVTGSVRVVCLSPKGVPSVGVAVTIAGVCPSYMPILRYKAVE